MDGCMRGFQEMFKQESAKKRQNVNPKITEWISGIFVLQLFQSSFRSLLSSIPFYWTFTGVKVSQISLICPFSYLNICNIRISVLVYFQSVRQVILHHASNKHVWYLSKSMKHDNLVQTHSQDVR